MRYELASISGRYVVLFRGVDDVMFYPHSEHGEQGVAELVIEALEARQDRE